MSKINSQEVHLKPSTPDPEVSVTCKGFLGGSVLVVGETLIAEGGPPAGQLKALFYRIYLQSYWGSWYSLGVYTLIKVYWAV